MPLPPGATIAGYRVLRLLGEGGMGAVYLVQHPDLPRKDVLKVMHGGMARQPALRERFEHEARLAAALNHPNIVQVFDRGLSDDQLWIRMQYVEGADAAQALADGPLEPRRVVHIVRSVGSALDYAHRAGLLHRDVKPANILLTPAGHADDAEHVLLTDFGIAKALDTDVRLTMSGQAFLTPAYSAPERFGSAPIDSRVDVYSLGCVAFELLTGQLPYPYSDFLVLLAAHDREPVPDVRELRPELPPGATEVLRIAMEKDREKRYPTCRAFAAALATALQAQHLPPVPPPTPRARETAHDTHPGTGPRDPTPVGGWTPGPVDPGPESVPELVRQSAGPRGPAEPGARGRPTGRRGRTIALVVAAVLLVAGGVTAAVSWPDGDEDGGTAAAGGTPPAYYGTARNTTDEVGSGFADGGALSAWTGIQPGAEISAAFQDRVRTFVPGLLDLRFAAESYDATVLLALAAEMAGSVDNARFRHYINGLTFSGERCTSYVTCQSIVRAGGNPNFDGLSGPLEFTAAGEPARASFTIVGFGEDGVVAAPIEYTVYGDSTRVDHSAAQDPAPTAATVRPLSIGTLLPMTGAQAATGPAMQAGVRLAVDEINNVGGVLGMDVRLVPGDSGDITTDTASQTLAQLSDDGVDAIIGTGSSDVTLDILPELRSRGIVMVAPADASDLLTQEPDAGLYFRMSPPVRLEATALAQRIVADGHESVAILAIEESYGIDNARTLSNDLVALGLNPADVTFVGYSASSDAHPEAVQHVVDEAPEAVVVLGYEESADLIAELNERGVGPAR